MKKPPRQGCKLDIDYEALVELIYKKGGKITHVASALGVTYRTLKQYLDREYPDIGTIIDDALKQAWEKRIDDSEQTVMDISQMNKEHPNAALSAAKLTLYSKRGRKRGWGPAEQNEADNDASDEEYCQENNINY